MTSLYEGNLSEGGELMEWSLRWKSCEHGPLSPGQYSRDVPRGSDLGWQGDGHSSPSTPFMRITPVVAYACVKDDNCLHSSGILWKPSSVQRGTEGRQSL